MKSYLKGLVHTVATLVALYIPTLVDHSQVLNMTIGSIIALGLNYLISHTIPTTNGASAVQALEV